MSESVKPFIPSCLRSGMCCTNITLVWSPKQLRDAYRAWRDSKPDTVRLKDIDIVYPMLAGRCRGKARYPDGHVMFIYGPCAHLFHEEIDGKRLAGCRIHEDKPDVCRRYPALYDVQTLTMTATPAPTNPANDQGCGYNSDPSHGTPQSFYVELIPLDESEK